MIMQGSSRRALAQLQEAFDERRDAGADSAAVSGDLLAVAAVLSAEIKLRGALADPGAEPDSRSRIAEQLFEGKIDTDALALLQEAVRARWSRLARPGRLHRGDCRAGGVHCRRARGAAGPGGGRTVPVRAHHRRVGEPAQPAGLAGYRRRAETCSASEPACRQDRPDHPPAARPRCERAPRPTRRGRPGRALRARRKAPRSGDRRRTGRRGPDRGPAPSAHRRAHPHLR